VSTLDEEEIEVFLGDQRLRIGVKLEDYLLIHLGARPCSQITLPAELPSGGEMGKAIDERVYPRLLRLRSMRGDDRRRAIEGVKKTMRRAYKEVVEASEEYKAHMKWAERLGLRWMIHEVRPTVRELYLYRDGETGRRLRRLMKRRSRLRKRALKMPQALGIYFAYPEEMEGEWVKEMGMLLGYPMCCVERYSKERGGGIDLELRARRQLEEAREVNPMAYYVSYFFPCSPSCSEAAARGWECYRLLRELHPRLGELYRGRMEENIRLIRRLPSLVEGYRAEAERRLSRWLRRTRQL
jgi:hypothetical protein